MEIEMSDSMTIAAILVMAIGTLFLLHVFRKELHAEREVRTPKGSVMLSVRLEFDRDSGAVYYVIENNGHAAAHDVRIYLPKCHEIASSKKGPSSAQLAAAVLKVAMKTYDRIGPGDYVEIPIVQVPPTEECTKDVYGLGLDAEVRWSNEQGDVRKDDFILPVSSRLKPRTAVAA